MAYIYIPTKTLINLIKTELDESTNELFPEFLISEVNKVIKEWNGSLDYNKLKKLQKTLDKVLADLE